MSRTTSILYLAKLFFFTLKILFWYIFFWCSDVKNNERTIFLNIQRIFLKILYTSPPPKIWNNHFNMVPVLTNVLSRVCLNVFEKYSRDFFCPFFFSYLVIKINIPKQIFKEKKTKFGFLHLSFDSHKNNCSLLPIK